MAFRIFGNGAQARLAQFEQIVSALTPDPALLASVQAQASAVAAKQDVVDTNIAALQAVAATLPTVTGSSAADRAALHAQVDSLAASMMPRSEAQASIATLNAAIAAVQTTPGPAGKSAYDIARDAGYGGTQTQWLATLKGSDGAKGGDGPVGPTGPLSVVAHGVALTPAILLGATSPSILITLDRVMPTANYTPKMVSLSTGLGSATYNVVSKTTTTVTITVTATSLAITAGQAVLISAEA